MARDAREARGAAQRARSGPPAVCSFRGCASGKRPTERKPFCIDHLAELPYVKELRAHLAGMEGEALVAQRQGSRAVDTKGARAQEILELLSRGAMSPKRLRIVIGDPSLPERAVDYYLRALRLAGLVDVMTLGSIRGTPRTVVDLTPAGRARVERVEGAA